jgi:hypothetical protein
MKIICHRGNLIGSNLKHENSPAYIKNSMDAGFYVEVDIWVIEDRGIWFGHDKPQYKIDSKFFEKNKEYDPMERIFFHCKNLDAIVLCNLMNCGDSFGPGCTYFSHDKDPYVLVSNGNIWTYPDHNNELSVLSIPVVYDRTDMRWTFEQLQICDGICTDDALYFDRLFNATVI